MTEGGVGNRDAMYLHGFPYVQYILQFNVYVVVEGRSTITATMGGAHRSICLQCFRHEEDICMYIYIYIYIYIQTPIYTSSMWCVYWRKNSQGMRPDLLFEKPGSWGHLPSTRFRTKADFTPTYRYSFLRVGGSAPHINICLFVCFYTYIYRSEEHTSTAR